MTVGSRVALVTGGSRGIGAAVVARLLSEGWTVVAAARNAPASAGAGPSSGGFVACDVADAGQVADLFAHVRQRYGRLDALVTAAGIAGPNPLDGDDAIWHAIIGSNLHGTYHCCKAALPMLPSDTGRIVTIASVLGLRGVPDQTAYCAAKHGVIGFTRALALAVASRGITVNAICPGWTDTEMARFRFADLGITNEDAAAQMPTGRIVAPEEVAATVSWLLRPETRSLTGHALPLDGGGLALP